MMETKLSWSVPKFRDIVAPKPILDRQPHMTSTYHLTDVVDGVCFVQGPLSNWVILYDDNEASLIDTGYPGDFEDLRASLQQLGRQLTGVTRVFITHAHTDHIGSAERLRRDYGATVYCLAEEAAHARREENHQVTVEEVTRHTHIPEVRDWLTAALAAGGIDDVAIGEVQIVEEGVPGSGPMQPSPIRVPGHTPGNAVYLLAGTRILASGDSIVAGHPTSTRGGPQMLDRMFHDNFEAASRNLDLLAGLGVDIVLPGHGPLLRLPISMAIAAVRA